MLQKIESLGWVQINISMIILSGLVVVVYSIVACLTYRCGYPLDDAWIHQVYARNLIDFHEWSFTPGKSSLGSTAPLWSILISIGYLINIKPLVWTNVLGWLTLFSLAQIVNQSARKQGFHSNLILICAGLLIIFEWHFVWAATSGMETLLCALINTLVILLLIPKNKSWFCVGIISGIGCWLRPDSFTLLLPIGFGLFFAPNSSVRQSLKNTLIFFVGYIAVVIPYFIFNQMIGNTWFPYTFFAKQAEYAQLQSVDLFRRILQQMTIPLVGVGTLLFPGFVYSIFSMIQKRKWILLGGVFWFCLFIILYAYRLPVTYQHGRYLIPVLPIYYFWGLAGTINILASLKSNKYWIIKSTWIFSIIAIQLIFFVLGTSAFSKDVAFIEDQMVNVALWIENSTQKDSVLAVHDIGAIGYFTSRELIDLAGLVSPDIIPFIRDQDKIGIYLNKQNADYLITFPSWYPDLIKDLTIAYHGNTNLKDYIGDEFLTVYFWQK